VSRPCAPMIRISRLYSSTDRGLRVCKGTERRSINQNHESHMPPQSLEKVRHDRNIDSPESPYSSTVLHRQRPVRKPRKPCPSPPLQAAPKGEQAKGAHESSPTRSSAAIMSLYLASGSICRSFTSAMSSTGGVGSSSASIIRPKLANQHEGETIQTHYHYHYHQLLLLLHHHQIIVINIIINTILLVLLLLFFIIIITITTHSGSTRSSLPSCCSARALPSAARAASNLELRGCKGARQRESPRGTSEPSPTATGQRIVNPTNTKSPLPNE
jgi:hypothetical protein